MKEEDISETKAIDALIMINNLKDLDVRDYYAMTTQIIQKQDDQRKNK